MQMILLHNLNHHFSSTVVLFGGNLRCFSGVSLVLFWIEDPLVYLYCHICNAAGTLGLRLGWDGPCGVAGGGLRSFEPHSFRPSYVIVFLYPAFDLCLQGARLRCIVGGVVRDPRDEKAPWTAMATRCFSHLGVLRRMKRRPPVLQGSPPTPFCARGVEIVRA